MKKFSLLIIALSLLLYSCDSTSTDTSTSDEQMSQAAAALKVVTDGMNVTVKLTSNFNHFSC